jgi:hypothetical protein
MRKTLILLTALMVLISCKERVTGCFEPMENMVEAKLDFECSGVYLITDNKVLKVCEAEELTQYSKGQTLNVSYEEISSCYENDTSIKCLAYIEHDAVVNLVRAEAKFRIAKVEKDCTGTYLDVNGTDYQICNSDKLKDVAEGTQLEVDFKEMEECTNPDNEYICYMAREFHGIAMVKSFKEID